ncbi:hypothetical protein ACQ86N_32975 [Puia sp. P3]|uniref:hypothetical protein n=1 Tax=Puia sp. P3 TaxID=3423952 RepID=UPI003D66D0AB
MQSNRRKNVFISGSAYEYGKFGDKGRDFIRELARTLLRNDFRIISGFGTGVGNYVVEGALHEIYVNNGQKMTDRAPHLPLPLQHRPARGRPHELPRRHHLSGRNSHLPLR